MNRIFLFTHWSKVIMFSFLVLFSVIRAQGTTIVRSELRGFIETNKRVIAQYVSDIGWDLWKASWAKGIAKKTAKNIYGINGETFDRIPWKFCLQKTNQIRQCVFDVGLTDGDIEYIAQGIEEFLALGTRDKNRFSLFLYAHLVKKIRLNGTISREYLERNPSYLEDQVGYGVNEHDYYHLNAANFIIKYYLELKNLVEPERGR